MSRQVELSRRRVETSWRSLRAALRRDLGREPRWHQGWLLPVIALAAGLALAWGMGRRRGGRRSRG